MSKLRDAAQQALAALEPYADVKPRDWKTDREKLWRSYDALRAALAEQPAEQELVRGEWQGYTWNPYAISQPKAEQEPVEATPPNLSRIAWELERTAQGEGFYGNALRVAKDIPGMRLEDRSMLDRYATGTQTGADHLHLQWLVQALYNTDDSNNGAQT